MVVGDASPAWLDRRAIAVSYASVPLPALNASRPDLLEEAEPEGEAEGPEGEADIPERDSGPGETSGLREEKDEADRSGEPEEWRALTDEARVLLSRPQRRRDQRWALEDREPVLADWHRLEDASHAFLKVSPERSSGKMAESTPLFAWIVIALIIVMFMTLATGVIAGLAMSDPTPSQASVLQNVWSAFFSILGALVGVIVGKLA